MPQTSLRVLETSLKPLLPLLVYLLQIIINRFDLFVGEIILGHHRVVSGDNCLDFIKRNSAYICALDHDRLIVFLIGYDLFSLSIFGMTCGTTNPSGVFIEHLSIFEIRDKILLSKQKKREEKPYFIQKNSIIAMYLILEH